MELLMIRDDQTEKSENEDEKEDFRPDLKLKYCYVQPLSLTQTLHIFLCLSLFSRRNLAAVSNWNGWVINNS